MKKLILSVVLISGIISGCKTPVEKDFSDLDNLITITDSLLEIAKAKFDDVSEDFYLLIEDSIKIDSVALLLNIPDSVGIYQYVENGITDLNNILSFTQEEIAFAQEHLQSLKSDFMENQISQEEYSSQLIESRELIQFLKERVDSNIYFIKEKYNIIIYSHIDSIPQ